VFVSVLAGNPTFLGAAEAGLAGFDRSMTMPFSVSRRAVHARPAAGLLGAGRPSGV